MIRRERAQSEVLGTVLLLGITVAAVTITVATGSVALAAITDDARSSGVENGMSQLTSQASLVALGETDAKRFDLGSIDEGDLRLDEDAGRVDIRVEGSNGTVTNESFSLGTLVYTGDRREVAIQGGGVWSLEGDRGRMISPPEYHYRGETLTFPIVQLTGDETSPNAGTGVVRRTGASEEVLSNVSNPLRNGTVVVEVKSDYYEGWYDFLSQRADGDVRKDDENRTVTARLVVPESRTFEQAMSIGHGGYSHGSGNGGLDETEYREDETHQSPEALISNQVESAAENGSNIDDCLNGSNACEVGTYYADGDYSVDEDVEFDTSDGDIDVVIDGDLNIDSNDLIITDDTDGTVRYFVNGSVSMSGDAFVGTTASEPESMRTVFYIADGFLEDSGDGNLTVEAIVYAPNSDTELSGNPTLRGAFVFDALHTQGNAFTVDFDETLVDFEVSIAGGAGQDPITYLHVSQNVVELRFDR